MVDADRDCLFCKIVAGDVESETVYADDATQVFLDVRPVFRGHCLVVPRRHVETLSALGDAELEPYFAVTRRIARIMPDALDAHGTFVCINNVVSQSVPHLHTHVIPRRFKDGLRGFLWPRHKYESDADAAAVAERLRTALVE